MSAIADHFAVYRLLLSISLVGVGGACVWLGYRLFSSGAGLMGSLDKLAIQNREFKVSITGMSAGSALMATSMVWGYWANNSIPKLEANGNQAISISQSESSDNRPENTRVASVPSDELGDARESGLLIIPAPDEQTAKTQGPAPDFRWPIAGKVVSSFGPTNGGGLNDGINIAAPYGTPVKSAEDGIVAYSGNELKGYGNLILIRHADGFVTAYANLSEISVKRGDTVKRGQIIGRVGQSGSVVSPQLHFEIRRGSVPVNPTQFVER